MARPGEVTTNEDFVHKLHRGGRPVVSRISDRLIRCELGRQRWVDHDDQVPTCCSGEDRCLDRSEAGYFRRRVPKERDPVDVVAIEVGEEPIRRALDPFLAEGRLVSSKHVAEQARSYVAIQEVVLESVLEAAQAPVAGQVAVRRTVLEQAERASNTERPIDPTRWLKPAPPESVSYM